MSFKIKNDNRAAVRSAMNAAVERALEKCGLVAEGYAKANITKAGRVDTGAMRNSVTHEVDGAKAQIGTNIEYAIYNEIGTSRMSGIHFLRNAVADHAGEYKRIIESELKA